MHSVVSSDQRSWVEMAWKEFHPHEPTRWLPRIPVKYVSGDASSPHPYKCFTEQILLQPTRFIVTLNIYMGLLRLFFFTKQLPNNTNDRSTLMGYTFTFLRNPIFLHLLGNSNLARRQSIDIYQKHIYDVNTTWTHFHQHRSEGFGEKTSFMYQLQNSKPLGSITPNNAVLHASCCGRHLRYG
jgi:hypothetical protein